VTASTFDNIPSIFFCTTDNGIIVEANKRLCDKLGYSENELIGEKLDNISPVATKIFYQTHLLPILRLHGTADEIYFTLYDKSKNEVPVLINAVRMDVEKEVRILYAGIRVYNRKRYEEELILAKKMAESALHENTLLLQAKEQLQKYAEQLDEQMMMTRGHNEELKQFNHVLTHDLYEPLRKVLMHSGKALGTNDVGRLETIQKINELATQMRSILLGLQQYVWLTDNELKIANVNLDQLVDKAAADLRRENPWVDIIINKAGLYSIKADEEQMLFLLYEILLNAVRFRKGDKVTINITGTTVSLNKFRAVKERYKYEDFLKLSIEDNGSGFDPEYCHQAFKLFRRLHKNSGRGVGLKLCKKIVDNHRGEITMNAEENKGSIVTILLPLHNDENVDANLKTIETFTHDR
jgi:phosphoserine phosphatase RsbU/P